jgi:ribosome-associated toxin RatA of RatAB toxin-antitoxin module
MDRTNEITIRAPLNKIFAVAANLQRWPEFLPHYRYNRYISQTPSGGVIKMACIRSGLKTTRISDYRIDPEKRQLHFYHRKSPFTRGMKVVWDFEELPGGLVRVVISYNLELKWSLIGPAITGWFGGRVYFHDIAEKTLAGLKRKVEAQEDSRLTASARGLPGSG